LQELPSKETQAMLGEEVFLRLQEQAPFTVMFRATAEHLLADSDLDALCDQTAQLQYTKELTFSALARLFSAVVLRTHPSVRAAYRWGGRLPVSLAAVYDKLQQVETAVSVALVEHVADRAATVLACGPAARRPDRVPGLHAVIVDGTYLAGTQRRLKPLRGPGAAARPGMAVALLDDRTGLLSRRLLVEDAYTNERALLDRVRSWLVPGQLLLADRNFCTLDFLADLDRQQIRSLIRHHQHVGWSEATPLTRGRATTGAVTEYAVVLADGRASRLIEVALDVPTREGEAVVRLLSNVPAEQAPAVVLAEGYRGRRGIEDAFQDVTCVLRCAVNTLAYPKAAGVGFALAVVAYNLLAVLRGAVGRVRGPAWVQQELSSYCMAEEITGSYRGMELRLPGDYWQRYRNLRAAALARWLQQMAGRIDDRRYRKSKRGPRPNPQVKRGKRGGHRSTARVLQNRQKK
jgi:hypothetical protein